MKGKHILEVGCGMGFDSLEFLKRGVRVTVTDSDTGQRLTSRNATMTLPVIGRKPCTRQTSLALPFPDNTFDGVWACGVVHHTGDTAKAIGEIRRVLKPGGRAMVSHMYRRPSWMYYLSKYGRENIEFKERRRPDHALRSRISEAFAMFERI